MIKEHGQQETKTRILDAAEQLFASEGFKASLRAITAAAGVNLAAINYHFGSKEELIRALLARRLEPLNRQRLDHLAAAQAAAGASGPTVEAIVDAFVAPTLRMDRKTPNGCGSFKRIMGRIFTEPDESMRRNLRELFAEIAEKFPAALQRALPALPPEELSWRLHFIIGAMAHTLAGAHYSKIFRDDAYPDYPADTESVIRHMVTFAAAGLRAGLSPAAEESKQ